MRNRPHVAAATCFVSHAWSYAFSDLLAALEHHAGDEQDTYFWLGAGAARAPSCVSGLPGAPLY